jgi:DNA-binding IclR family transcriptional regulator
MSTDTILELLENGRWHYLKEIEEKTHLNSGKVETVTKFLAKYKFIELDETKHRIKIDPPTNRFLKKIRKLEEKSQ